MSKSAAAIMALSGSCIRACAQFGGLRFMAIMTS